MSTTPTTDPQDQIFDVVNEEDGIVGSATRRACHADNRLIHREVFVAVFNQAGEILLQKRSQTKDSNPGLWTLSTSGHVDQGEDPDVAAQREVQEEIGVQCAPVFVSKELARGDRQTIFLYLYTAEHEGPFILHPDEVAAVQFFSRSALESAIVEGTLHLTEKALMLALRWLSNGFSHARAHS